MIYGGTDWVDPTDISPGNDNGGIHHNCGVLSKVFQLLVDGGTHNSHTISSIGFDKAIKIMMGTVWRLNSADDFLAVSTTMRRVTQTYYGDCSDETEAVMEAWSSVNVGAPYTPCVSFGGWKNQAIFVRAEDADSLNLIAVSQYNNVTSRSWVIEPITIEHTISDSLLEISSFPEVPAFYDLIVNVTTMSDTLSDTIRINVIDNNDPICLAGQFNKWNPNSSVGEFETIDKTKIYPNPGKGLIEIEVPSSVGLVNIDVTSSTGNLIRKLSQVGGSLDINMSDVSKGIYYIKVYNQEQSSVTKYIKIR